MLVYVWTTYRCSLKWQLRASLKIKVLKRYTIYRLLKERKHSHKKGGNKQATAQNKATEKEGFLHKWYMIHVSYIWSNFFWNKDKRRPHMHRIYLFFLVWIQGKGNLIGSCYNILNGRSRTEYKRFLIRNWGWYRKALDDVFQASVQLYRCERELWFRSS